MRGRRLVDTLALSALRAAEARMLQLRAAPPDPAAALDEALRAACGRRIPAGMAGVGQRIAAAVQAHGQSLGAREPAYHDRHHQAEATLAAGWLAGRLRRGDALDLRQAALCVLAMAGHDLLHTGAAGMPAGTLEAISAQAVDRMAETLDDAARAEIARLILLTDPAQPVPLDPAGQLMREADLLGSLTPELGWRLSAALAQELTAAGVAQAEQVNRFAGRLAILRRITVFTPAGDAIGLAAGCELQAVAMAEAADTEAEADGAAALDALPRDAAMAAYGAALARLGLPALPDPSGQPDAAGGAP